MAEVILQILKGHPGQDASLREYRAPYSAGMSLLDAVLWIRDHEDPDLAVRFSCRVSNACKECSASIDGKAGYLCNTKARPDIVTEIRPLPKMLWIKDLVTQME